MCNSAYVNLAILAALSAGELLKKGFRSSLSISNKEGKQNLVTQYDLLSEQMLMERIQKEYKDHSFLTEESGLHEAKSEWTWVIDPLDGTVNFAKGIPCFAVSIALFFRKEPVMGTIFHPLTQELFVAEKGKGAFLNGQHIQVSSTSSFENSFLATGLPYNVHENPLDCLHTLSTIAQTGAPIRRLGAACIDLAYVACGRFDAFWEVVLQPWDFAAASLLVQEAGGIISNYAGNPLDPFLPSPVIGGNPAMHAVLQKTIANSLPQGY